MHMPSDLLPTWLYILCNVIAFIAIGIAIARIDKSALRKSHFAVQSGVVFVVICGLYSLYVGTQPGMTLHWLGVMMTVMMFGPWYAVLLLSTVHATFAFGFGIGGMEALGFNIVVCVIVPTIVAAICHIVAYYKLPRNFPVYIIKVGVGDLLCMLSVDLVLTIVLFAFFNYPSFLIWQEFTLLLALMGGMEAVISTWIASLLVCFLPSWLTTFSDEEYLHGK